MIVGRVVGNVVATEKHPHYRGRALLVVQPLDACGRPKGREVVAVDGVQAGIGDRVLVVDEGGSARNVIGDDTAVTVRTVVCGIVDRIDIEADAGCGDGGGRGVNR